MPVFRVSRVVPHRKYEQLRSPSWYGLTEFKLFKLADGVLIESNQMVSDCNQFWYYSVLDSENFIGICSCIDLRQL
jgi:hypothetical protein